jgi:glucokinase
MNTLCPAPDLPLGTSPVPPYPWLVADIGGTNARFGWVARPGAAVEHVQRFTGADHAGPAEAATHYLAHLAGQLGAAFQPPRAAAWAVATAVVGDRIELTNSGWGFSCAAARAALGLERLVPLNDFEALALALPHLAPGQWRAIGPELAVPAMAARAVVGPGTGLGVAGIVHGGLGWLAVPGEGGHATLAPADDYESALLAAARRQVEHVSAERLLSGIGLPLLHRSVALVEGVEVAASTPEQIVEAGLRGDDALASRTIDVFCALLGSFAGSVALTYGARGGVYIGGGIVPRLGERFFASRFRERFEAKGRFRGYLEAVPTMLITDTLAALTGAAAALRAPAR